MSYDGMTDEEYETYLDKKFGFEGLTSYRAGTPDEIGVREERLRLDSLVLDEIERRIAQGTVETPVTMETSMAIEREVVAKEKGAY